MNVYVILPKSEMNMLINKILLVGAGHMAKEYAKVLTSQGADFVVVGRSANNCEDFRRSTGKEAISGGLHLFLQKNDETMLNAIVCVGIEELLTTTLELIHHGYKNILIEKPGGINENELLSLCSASRDVNVFVAYNRRFYASVQKAREIIEKDGGVTSFHFEFTEWGHEISGLNKIKAIKDEWLYANSSHVIDMAFYLGGFPKDFKSYSKGNVKWGDCSAIYAGAGISDKGALFSYCANWEAPGRWSVEVLTLKHRLIFKPLEKLQIQRKGSLEIEELELDNALDLQYKPGLFRQVEAFLNLDDSILLSVSKQYSNMMIYNKIKTNTDNNLHI